MRRITQKQLHSGIAALRELSLGEFRTDLAAILTDTDHDLAIKRVGRLMAVWTKQPFSTSGPYDPSLPWNWARSYRAWQINPVISRNARTTNAAHYDMLASVAAEWGYPIQSLAEYHVFFWLCKRLQPVICGTSEILKEANAAAEKLRKSGGDVAMFSPTNLVSATSASIGTYLVLSTDFLSAEHLPIVTGFTILLTIYGRKKLCKFFSKFTELKCGSIRTKTGKPCCNPVKKLGQRCHRHPD